MSRASWRPRSRRAAPRLERCGSGRWTRHPATDPTRRNPESSSGSPRTSFAHLLVDHPDMASDRFLDMVGKPDGPLADASLWHLEVLDTEALSPSMTRLVLTAPDLGGLRYLAGQDLMFRIPRSDGAVTNRRYTIRGFDPVRASVVVDVSLHGAGPGTDWVREATAGDRIDAIGPRGKVTLREGVDWHLFVADETGMPGALAMIEALPLSARATALLEIDTAADQQELEPNQGQLVDLHWIHRLDRSTPGDAGRSKRRSSKPVCHRAADTPMWRPRPALCGASRGSWRNGVSSEIRSRRRRTGGAVSPMQTTENLPGQTDAARFEPWCSFGSEERLRALGGRPLQDSQRRPECRLRHDGEAVSHVVSDLGPVVVGGHIRDPVLTGFEAVTVEVVDRNVRSEVPGDLLVRSKRMM